MSPDVDSLSPDDVMLLQRAVVLGRQGWGQVHPNPMVGCVIAKDGVVVGEGWHERFGGPHAEVMALREAGSRALRGTAYVSLEPCDHHGKTPPCSQALIEAGIERVVFAAEDPGVDSAGGANHLREAGVNVIGPVWDRDRARAENPGFYHRQELGRPWVAIKLAQSLDGRIAARPGERTRITGDESSRWVHWLRSGFDALLVGSRTARIDDPLLTVREGAASRVAPARIVFDSRCALSQDAAVFRSPGGPVVVVTGSGATETRVQELERAGARVVIVSDASGGIDVTEGLAALGRLGFHSILCEGGGVLASALIAAGEAERLYLLTAGHTLGAGGVPVFGEASPALPWRAWRPHGPPQWLGNDRLSVYRRSY